RVEQFRIVGVLWQDDSPEMRRTLGANERRVEDWYITPDDLVGAIKGRITSDPSDSGRNYRRDAMGNESEDLDVVREITRCGDIAQHSWKAKSRVTPGATKAVISDLVFYSDRGCFTALKERSWSCGEQLAA